VTSPDGGSIRAAAGAVRELLGRVPDGNADVPAMSCSVTAVAGHLNSCLAFYAHDLAAGPADVSGMAVTPRPDASLAELTAGLAAWAEVLARTVDAAGPDDRGSHSDGIADAAGFAAIAPLG
jgi:hypothetical protein